MRQRFVKSMLPRNIQVPRWSSVKIGLEARQETTNALIEQYGYVLIHPYDNDQIIAGAGTVAYEFLQNTQNWI